VRAQLAAGAVAAGEALPAEEAVADALEDAPTAT
jgi:hypothetical protein